MTTLSISIYLLGKYEKQSIINEEKAKCFFYFSC